LILLNLIHHIYIKIKEVVIGSIKVYTHNYKIAKGVNKRVFKAIEYATDGPSLVRKIR